MADMNELIKKIALLAIEETKPTTVVFGEVTSVSPLKITIDQKFTLSEDFLILTSNVKDHDVYMTFDFSTETTSLSANHTHNAITEDNVKVDVSQKNISLNHSHSVKGKKKFTIHNGLSKGEKVILIRFNKGQKFLVLDRVVK